MPRNRILIYVQHLLGVGHIFRVKRLAERFGACGFDVTIAYGGEPVPGYDPPGVRVHYLPSLRWRSGNSTELITRSGVVADEAYLEARKNELLALFDRTAPDVLMTEAFPFGRRQMHFELLPLLDHARSEQRPPLIMASIRDILQEGNKVSKDRQTVELVERYFDAVLVHGDPNLIPLDATFPFAPDISARTVYTGIVTPRIEAGGLAAAPTYDVVVSAGGGMLGRELIASALQARPLCGLRDARWCVCTGPYAETGGLPGFRTFPEDDRITLKPFVDDLPHILAHAELSVSLAGYNTVADIMAAGCRAVIAPQWNEKETEQLRRAELLAERGLAVMIGHEDKTPDKLARAMDRALAMPAPDWSVLRTNGAERTVDTVEAMLARRGMERMHRP